MPPPDPQTRRIEAIHLVTTQDGFSIPFENYRAEQKLDHEHWMARIEANERLQFQKLRIRWSNWILGCIVGITFFDFYIIFNIGFGWMNFDNKFIIPAFLGESIIKVIGLAIIIVRFLFSKDSLAKEK